MPEQRVPIVELCQCLRGQPPANADWTSIIGLANRTLATPKLIDCIHRSPDQVPPDVSRYITEIFERNLLRNDRLKAKLTQAVTALNEKGVIPVLVKGAAILMTKDRALSAKRLISDLDIVVAPHESETALACLLALGYSVHYQAPSQSRKWYADLQRPGDVGMIDLQCALPGNTFFYRSHGDLKQYCKPTMGEHGQAYIPSSVYQVLLLIVHDQFQDSDYWVGDIDLRHLLDMWHLIEAPEGFNWPLLASLSSSKLMRNAVETQLVTLFSLFDVKVPPEMRTRAIPRLQYWRRLTQARIPALRRPLLSLALLDLWHYRTELGHAERLGYAERHGRHQEPRPRVLPKINTMRFLLQLSHEYRPGKV